jgi:hypothetical protein
MLERVIISCVLAATTVAETHTSDYSFTVRSARKAVLQYCHHDCAQLFRTPPRPCCDVFEQAMHGDRAALWRVFTERGLQSGDNESWSFTAWPLLHVVGDKHFAVFLRSLNARQQADVFKQVFYEGSYYAEAIGSGYFARHFPDVAAIYLKLQPRKHLTMRWSQRRPT